MRCLIPARSGSRTIPDKNYQVLGGMTLVQRVVAACPCEYRIIGDSKSPPMDNLVERPNDLSGDDTPIIDVIRWYCETYGYYGPIALLQPTSPFVTRQDVEGCLKALDWAASSQTIIEVPHNHHEQNQRDFLDEHVRFVHPDRHYNKQGKPPRHVFGNCVAFDPMEAFIQNTCFPEPSRGILLDNRFRAIDIDGPDDLKLAQAVLSAGLV